MDYILDTNILLLFIKNPAFRADFISKFNIFQKGNYIYLSVVTIGEIRSIAAQNKWGDNKRAEMENFIRDIPQIPIEGDDLLDTYADIDAFSQGKHPFLSLPTGMSARNMGKNDLWIAATAKVLEATLITTDKDFAHLSKVMIELETIMLWILE